jgi:hypothetical protein
MKERIMMTEMEYSVLKEEMEDESVDGLMQGQGRYCQFTFQSNKKGKQNILEIRNVKKSSNLMFVVSKLRSHCFECQ